jgi:general stress protein 26
MRYARRMAAKKASRARKAAAVPRARPLRFTPGYSPSDMQPKLLTWSFADTRLRKAHNYWVCSTRPDGRPHAAPVWGLWLNGGLVFSTDPSSRKAKNLRDNAAIAVHLESGDDVVIVEGRVEPCELTKQLDALYFRKYKVHLIGFPAPMVVLQVRVRTVQAWRESKFPASATLWSFGAHGLK